MIGRRGLPQALAVIGERSCLAIDEQGLFENHQHKSDFLTAWKVEDAIGLCLSGGGYHHIGVVIRLNELGLLPKLQ